MIKPIETIQESENKAIAIVQDLLTLSRGAASVKETININYAVLSVSDNGSGILPDYLERIGLAIRQELDKD